MFNYKMDISKVNRTNATILEDIGGINFILKYASIYIPYTTLSLVGFIVGLFG
jgi:hypothetical protein